MICQKFILLKNLKSYNLNEKLFFLLINIYNKNKHLVIILFTFYLVNSRLFFESYNTDIKNINNRYFEIQYYY